MRRIGGGAMRGRVLAWLLGAVPIAVIAAGAYIWFVTHWSYSSGERAGWVQKFSKKGWLCKTWEGELAIVSLPGSTPEKFYFTVVDDEVADRINRSMGRRVALHYEEKVGIPTSCFGDTRYFVTSVAPLEEFPGAPSPAPAAPGKAPQPSAPK